MYYKLTNKIEEIPDAKQGNLPERFVAIMTVSQWVQYMADNDLNPTPTTAYENSFVCKIEPYQDGFFGTFSIPIKNAYKTRDHFACYVTKDRLFLIDDDQSATDVAKKISAAADVSMSIGRFFVHFVESIVANDLRYLEELESRVSNLEEAILNDEVENFNRKMIPIRKELSEYHRYYTQMMDMGQSLQMDYEGLFSKRTINMFKMFTERVARLLSEVTILRDTSMQVQEVYQSIIDIKQNQIMRILTVVTAIFLPLTLIVGWYGMNFVYMPELKWKLGYPFVIILCVVVVVVCMRIFKKKNYW